MVRRTHPTPPQVQKAGASLPIATPKSGGLSKQAGPGESRSRSTNRPDPTNPDAGFGPGVWSGGSIPGSISVAALLQRCVTGRSVAPADRRIDRAMQCASLLRRAAPGDRFGAAREIANALTLALRPERTDELADDAQRLIVFLDARFDPADVGLLSYDAPSRRLGDRRSTDQKRSDNHS
jgi:hypothetical protein